MSQERCREVGGEGWREDRAEFENWEDRGRSTSPDTGRGKEQGQSPLFERNQRSSSEERESGEI